MTEVFYMPQGKDSIWQLGNVVQWVMDGGKAFAIIADAKTKGFVCIPMNDVIRVKL